MIAVRLASLATLLLLIAVPLAVAQPLPPATEVALTLEDALARAQQTSHRLAEARAREQGAQATVRVRRTADQPTFGASGSYSRTNPIDEFAVPQPDGGLRVIYPNIPNNYRTRVFGQWPIYTAGRTDALERSAAAEARAAGADIETARADLRLEVVRAYWGLATATESVRVLEEALQRADADLRDVRSRFDAGLIPPNEVLILEAQRARDEVQLIEARNLRESVAIDLRRLTDLPADAMVTAADRLESPASGSDEPMELLLPLLQQRSDRQALLFRIDAAEGRRSAAHAGRLPTINLTGGVDYARPNTRIFPLTDEWRTSWDVGVNVNWTFWDAGRTRAETDEAAFVAAAARERLLELDETMTAEVRQRRLDIASSLAAVRAAGEGVRSAAEARRVVGERLAVGVATSSDVLDAQVALLQAELDRTRALANVRLAQARLDRALGR